MRVAAAARAVPFVLMLVLGAVCSEAAFAEQALLPLPVSLMQEQFTHEESTAPAERGSWVAARNRKGLPFTKTGKKIVKEDNAARNQGQTRCENCGTETVPAQQHKKGITPPSNETHVDHLIPRVEGGKGAPDNGQVLCRECNLKKGDKSPETPQKPPSP